MVGGVVGAVVAFACVAYMQPKMPESFEKLKVKELIVSDKMMLVEDGKENFSLLIQNGGMLATTRVIAQQLCSNAVLANAVLTTPDNVLNPLDKCQIFTEMGSSKTEGGLLTVRSPDGANVISNPDGIKTGSKFTVTYTPNGRPMCLFSQNGTGEQLEGIFRLLEPGMNGSIAIAGSTSPGATPLQNTEMPHPPHLGTPVNQTPSGLAGENPLMGNQTPVAPSPIAPNPGIDQSAMYPSTVPR